MGARQLFKPGRRRDRESQRYFRSPRASIPGDRCVCDVAIGQQRILLSQVSPEDDLICVGFAKEALEQESAVRRRRPLWWKLGEKSLERRAVG